MVEINLLQQNQRLVLQVKDNGRGFDEQNAQNGNGLRNLRERAIAISGSLTLKTALDEGTEVELQLPIA
jgi:signal transduction histidine kinase